ncbi:MAG: RIP metalloprotease [bacterium]|nr:RIP metalloprotease [bacterium]
MSDSTILVIQYLLGISILGTVYFLGRLLFSFWFYTIDEHIFLGFGKKLFGFKYKGVEVSVGFFIPLPWLAKLYAVVDGEKHKLGLPWEFHETPIWKRLIATFGGMIASLFIGVLIFVVLSYLTKDTYYSRAHTIDMGIHPGEFGKEVGFKSGDKVIKLNGEEYERFDDLISPHVINSNRANYTILRGTDTLEITFDGSGLDHGYRSVFELNYPFEVGMVPEYTNAAIAGLEKGDKIIEIDNSPVAGLPPFSEILEEKSLDTAKLTINRSGEVLELDVLVDEDGKIGFFINRLIEPESVQRSVLQACFHGTKEAFSIIYVNVRALRIMFVGDVDPRKNVNGPISIAKIYGGKDGIDWIRFLRITGLFLMITLFYNLLPIPKAAIMEVIPLIYEFFSKRAMSAAAFRKVRLVPFVLIIGLMVFVVIQDIMMLF